MNMFIYWITKMNRTKKVMFSEFERIRSIIIIIILIMIITNKYYRLCAIKNNS